MPAVAVITSKRLAAPPSWIEGIVHCASASGCERTAPVLVKSDMSLLISGDINMGLVSRELLLIVVLLWCAYERFDEAGRHWVQQSVIGFCLSFYIAAPERPFWRRGAWDCFRWLGECYDVLVKLPQNNATGAKTLMP